MMHTCTATAFPWLQERPQVSRRLARRLGTELRGQQVGYVHLIAATYASLVRELDARDGALLAKELVVQPVVSPADVAA